MLNARQSYLVKGLAIAVLASTFAGCAAGKKPVAPPIAYLPPPVEVAFPSNLGRAALNPQVPSNRNEPSQMVVFALSLGQRGRHLEAAEIFREESTKYTSSDNEFKVACLAAAANEFLLANDIRKFQETTALLRQTMSKLQVAAADESTIALVLALGDIAAGVDRPSSYTPKALRELYPQTPRPTLAEKQ